MDTPLTSIQIVYAISGSLGLFLLGIIAVGVWRR